MSGYAGQEKPVIREPGHHEKIAGSGSLVIKPSAFKHISRVLCGGVSGANPETFATSVVSFDLRSATIEFPAGLNPCFDDYVGFMWRAEATEDPPLLAAASIIARTFNIYREPQPQVATSL